MATKMIRQTSFGFGQVDQQVWKRTEINEYLTAAQSLLNMEVGTTLLAKKRKGTSLSYNVTGIAQANSRMYEFVDINDNYYIILATAGFFYVFSAPSVNDQVITITPTDVVTIYGTNVVCYLNNLALAAGPIAWPYQSQDLSNLDYTQDNDTLIISSPNYAPGRIFISSYASSPFPTFAFMYLDIYPLPAYNYNTINYNNFTVVLSVTGNILTFILQGVGNPEPTPFFNNNWIGGQILGGGTSVTQPLGYAIITNVVYDTSNGGEVTFTATVQLPFQTVNYATASSQYVITQPVWVTPPVWPAVNSVTSGYPKATLFFQNRLWFANTNSLPSTIFGSKINQPVSFDIGTGADTDAIVYTIDQTNTGPILWLNAGKQLEIFSQNDEFACPQDQNSALTPFTFSIRQQSSYGSSPNLKPVTYINDSYYSNRNGMSIINYHYNGIGLTYTSSNITLASQSLVKNPTNRALLRGSDTSQDNFVYFINPDNTMTSFQFAHEYKLAALTPIEFQEFVNLIDIVTINNSVYILKAYTLAPGSGNPIQYTIELLDETTRMDCTQVAPMTVGGLVTGLDLLDGYTAQVLYKGQDYGQYLVINGQLQINNPPGIADNVLIGLIYDNDLVPMYPFAGATESPFKKQIQRIYIDYYQSLEFYVNGYLVPYQRFPMINNKPLIPVTDTLVYAPFTGWNRFNTTDTNGNIIPIISITQSSPFDLQILAIGYQVAAAVI
jgi:hypothetical protein